MHGDIELATAVLVVGLFVCSVTLSIAMILSARQVARALRAKSTQHDVTVER